MAEIVDLASFRASRTPPLRFQRLACLLCDAEVEGYMGGDEVRYACSGDMEPHNLLEWSHSPEHVVIGK